MQEEIVLLPPGYKYSLRKEVSHHFWRDHEGMAAIGFWAYTILLNHNIGDWANWCGVSNYWKQGKHCACADENPNATDMLAHGP